MHRIVVLEAGAVIATLRRPAFAHEWVEYAATRQEQVAERLAGATIAVVNKRQLGAELLAGLPTLRLIAIAATGYNNVDLEACRARGIVVCNVRGYARQTVPEHVFALLLALARQIGPYHRSVVAGRWQRSEQFCYFDYPIRDLAGQTLGLLGAGSLGEGVARIAAAFGMHVLRGERKGAASVREGWGLNVSEAAACGTPFMMATIATSPPIEPSLSPLRSDSQSVCRSTRFPADRMSKISAQSVRWASR